jgi:hypothetical protein
MPLQYQFPRPKPPILGPSAGAPQSYVFAVNQPQRARSYQVVPKTTGQSGNPSPPLTPIYPRLWDPPDRNWSEAYLNTSRYASPPRYVQVDIPPLVPFPQSVANLQNPDSRYWAPPTFDRATKLPLLGPPPAPPDTQIYSSIVMPQGYGERPKPIIVQRSIKGISVPTPLVPLFPYQPTVDWWAAIDRTLLAGRSGTTARLDGPGSRPTFIFPTNQPERSAWYVPNLASLSAPPLRAEGTIAQQTYVFVLGQPERAYYLDKLAAREAGSPKQLTGVFTPPPVAQSYVFILGQPTRYTNYVPRTPSEQVLPILEQGPHIFVPIISTQPVRLWWPLAQMPVQQFPLDVFVAPIVFKIAWAVNSNQLVGMTPEEPETH